MASLAASATITLTLSDFDSITVSCLGPVLVEALSGLGVPVGRIAEMQGMRSFGPFASGGQLKLTTYGYDAQYEIADGKVPAQPVTFAQDDAGNITGLSGPDGGAYPLRGEVFNLHAQSLLKWRRALARVRSGTGRARLALVGDSTTAGTGSAGVGTTNAVPGSYPTQLANVINTYFAPALATSTWGKNMLPATDPRVTAPNWTASSFLLNGNSMRASAITDTMTFAPGVAWDTADVWYADMAGHGTFTVNADGGAALATVIPSGTGGIRKVTITKALGVGVLGVARTTGGAVYIAGMVTYDSTAPKVDVYNLGWHGSTVGDWAIANASYINNIPSVTNLPTLAADLSVICLTINDASFSTNVDTYKSNLQAIISAALTTGDVIMMAGVPSSIASASIGRQQSYIKAMRSLAIANRVPFINLMARFGSYEIANPLGYYTDTLHPSAAGYNDVAQAVANVIGRP